MTNKNESAAWVAMRSNVALPHDRFMRVENIVFPGTPDSNYCLRPSAKDTRGREGWIEVKAAWNTPKRVRTPLLPSNEKLNQDQKNWFLAHRNAGGTGWIYIDGAYTRWLLSCEHADNVNEMTPTDLTNYAAWSRPKPTLKADWLYFRIALYNGHD